MHLGLIPSFCAAAAWEEPSCHHQYSPHAGNDATGYRSAICLFQWQRYSVAESIASVLMDLHLLTPRLITVPSSQHLPQCREKIQVEETCMQSGCLGGLKQLLRDLLVTYGEVEQRCFSCMDLCTWFNCCYETCSWFAFLLCINHPKLCLTSDPADPGFILPQQIVR